MRIAAIGYGKLGGMELGYSSDLDIVFVHDSAGERQETDAPRPIDNQVFFVRLAQRIVHLLTMHSAAGRLYEVDVRLRPSGKGGMLVTSIRAFAEYQRSEAWTWEHQALLHARSVAGAPQLRAEFERVRLDTLQHHVRRETLREEVRAMRERMRRELVKAGAGEFDIKQGEGGVADIEFLAQYWALLWAKDHPPVAMFSDTIRQLESAGFREPGAAGGGGHPHGRLSRVSRPHASSVPGRPRAARLSRRIRRRARGGDAHLERGLLVQSAHARRIPTAASAQRPERIPGHGRGSAALLPDAADAAVEFPSAGLSADRAAERLGEVPVLRGRVHPAAMIPARPPITQLSPPSD